MENYSSSFQSLFYICLAVNIFACYVNHIDDTDETYGYWEVLHYLSFGRGMQTWEYAPKFAIRTYSFIAPLVPFVQLYAKAGLSKPDIFLGMRLLFATFTAFSEASFLTAVETARGIPTMRLTALFLVFAPGVFFASTSYLPSAIIMNVVMVAVSCWIRERFLWTLFLGCVAVLFTGWPYVGVIFFPLGLHMLYRTGQRRGGLRGIFSLVTGGLVSVVVVAGVAALIDKHYYGIWTFPSINTVKYNAGGSGDNLYGIETTGYYIRNLLLTMGLAWPLAVVAPVLLLREYAAVAPAPAPASAPAHAASASDVSSSIADTLVVYSCAALWLAVLFSRPHKEERFMYPVYPIIAYMGAVSIVCLCDMIGDIVADLTSEVPPPLLADDLRELSALESYEGEDKTQKLSAAASKRRTWGYMCKQAVLILCITGCVTLCFARVYSQYYNYSGYMQAWGSVSAELESAHAARAQAQAQAPDQSSNIKGQLNGKGMGKGKEGRSGAAEQLTVCTGGEWYKFASSFFLPANTRLAFVQDTFRAQLPQYFTEFDMEGVGVGGSAEESIRAGTAAAPAHMNDLNREEPSRYVTVGQCDYVLASVEIGDVTATEFKTYSPMLRKMIILKNGGGESVGEGKKGKQTLAGGSSGAYPGPDIDPALMGLTDYFVAVSQHEVLNLRRSGNSIARAFAIPGYSSAHNVMMHYTLFKRVPNPNPDESNEW